jgi:hypothetical protein
MTMSSGWRVGVVGLNNSTLGFKSAYPNIFVDQNRSPVVSFSWVDLVNPWV